MNEIPIVKEVLPKTNEVIQDHISQYKQLNTELHNVSELIVPLMREYLKDIQSIRMAFTREIQDILRSSVELKGVTRLAEDLHKLSIEISVLKQTLTPETVEMLRKITKE